MLRSGCKNAPDQSMVLSVRRKIVGRIINRGIYAQTNKRIIRMVFVPKGYFDRRLDNGKVGKTGKLRGAFFSLRIR